MLSTTLYVLSARDFTRRSRKLVGHSRSAAVSVRQGEPLCAAAASLLQSAADSLGGRVTTVETGKREKEHSYMRLEVNELLAGRLST